MKEELPLTLRSLGINQFIKSERFINHIDVAQEHARQRTAYAIQEICKLPVEKRLKLKAVYTEDMQGKVSKICSEF